MPEHRSSIHLSSQKIREIAKDAAEQGYMLSVSQEAASMGIPEEELRKRIRATITYYNNRGSWENADMIREVFYDLDCK